MNVKTGLQVLSDTKLNLSSARVGLVTHPAAVLPDLSHSLEALQISGIQISALFGPEHGYLGFEADAAQVSNTIDPRTGLPAYSLYGDHLSPTPEMLEGVDLLLFDMQDVGVRFYTFISTLYHVLKAAGELNTPVMVLDRPNPLGGFAVESPLVDPGYESFVGITSMPVQHGMTVGELARWMNTRMALNADLQVVTMKGWERRMLFHDTGLPWVPTSPGIPHLSTVYAYPCTCLIEGTNLSEGRGTALPFEVFGAPWLDGFTLANELNQVGLPGVRFRPTHFQPTDSKHAGSICQGIQLHITDPYRFQALPCGLTILQKLIQNYPQFSFLQKSWEGEHPHIDLLLGNKVIREQLLAGASTDAIMVDWAKNKDAFDQDRNEYLLYS